MTDGAPRWDLLPHNPAGFFGLSGDFDRRDLKRSYGRLIKQFKPEKHPAEFQRIREAYESLEEQLRYGERIERESAPQPTFDWQSAAAHQPPQQADQPQAPLPPANRPPARQAPAPLHLRLQTESAADLYRELNARPGKTPYDYFALAVLSDVVVREEKPMAFVEWVLSGLNQFPHEQGLFNLLYDFCRSDVPDRYVNKLLLAVARVVRDQRYYFLTEPLWDRLLTISSFAQFRKTLGECERRLQDFHRIEGKVIFYLHMLKRALWNGDADWIDEAYAFIDEHSFQIPGRLEYEVEVLSQLREYMAERDKFLNGSPIRTRLDQALQDYCLLEDFESDQKIIALQVELANRPVDVQNAFPMGDEFPGCFVQIWTWICSEVRERWVEAAERRAHLRPEHVRSLLHRVDAKLDRSWDFWRFWLGTHLVQAVIWLIITLVVHFALRVIVGSPISPWLAIAAGACLSFWIAQQQFFIQRVYVPQLLHTQRTFYRRAGRRELFEFVQRNHLSEQEVFAALKMVRRQSGVSGMGLAPGQGDAALLVYAIALGFVV